MRALVFEEPHQAAIRELDVPSIAADEVLVRSRNVGICHSDFELYEGRYIIPVAYPIIPGHEWSGTVEAVGAGGPPSLVDRKGGGEGFRNCQVCDRCHTGATKL